MTPVSNSSVLIGLSSIGHQELIHDRFPSGIIIPPAVHHEVVITGSNRPGAQAVANAGWITQHPLTNQNLVNLLQTTLDHGESEAIALAVEQQINIILLDEKDARRAAIKLGIQPLGTVGILLWAKQTGRIPSLRQALDALRTQGNFHLSNTVIAQALRAAAE